MGPRRAAGIGALALAVWLPACSLGEKQDIADRAAASREIGDEPRVASVSLTATPLDIPDGVALAPDQLVSGPYALLAGTIEPAAHRSTLLAPPAAAARIAALTGAAPEAPSVLVFADRTTTVVRRPARDVVAARAWYQLELDRANDVTKPDPISTLTDRGPSDLAVLTPTLMTDLLAGVLPGSIEEDGNVITGRFSVEKANREDDLDDDAIEAREDALRLFAVTDDVNDFTLTLADDGSIAALEVRMRMRPNKQMKVELTWSMEVHGQVLALESPSADAAIRITSFEQARGAVAAWTGLTA